MEENMDEWIVWLTESNIKELLHVAFNCSNNSGAWVVGRVHAAIPFTYDLPFIFSHCVSLSLCYWTISGYDVGQ